MCDYRYVCRDGGMVDAQVLKTCGSNPVRVRSPLSAHKKIFPLWKEFFMLCVGIELPEPVS